MLVKRKSRKTGTYTMYSPDMTALRRFYATRLGGIAQHYVSAQLESCASQISSQNIIGLGYAQPYLELFRERGNYVLSVIPDWEEPEDWPIPTPFSTLIAQELELPFRDNSVDCVILAHMLEFSEQPTLLMQEIWRVLGPLGQVISIMPNRQGLWAHMENTPFGAGRPYSVNQWEQLCEEVMLVPQSHQSVLFTPPGEGWLSRPHRLLEKFGRNVMPALGGVLIATAQKQIYALTPEAKKRAKQRIFAPVMGTAETAIRSQRN